MNKTHSFHIPVMGIGFTADSPIKVAHLGIDSVISLVDDVLLEKIRKVYSSKFGMDYSEIRESDDDYRANRVESYLNMVQEIAERKLEELKQNISQKTDELKAYIQSLPEGHNLREDFKQWQNNLPNRDEILNRIKNSLKLGSIDVNIMTKVDKTNYKSGVELPTEYNDAHAALRGFAKSNLSSSIILSAGMNPRLYAYIENFDDFYPDAQGQIKKKIILKVSDFKSALIQGKYLAKKGIWVSEFRIESGLNCGGHAFASDGYLLGPILEEFKLRRAELLQSMHEILVPALTAKSRPVPTEPITIHITAQGGVGTAEEHNFLLNYYQLDSVGWGSPFLLVPEATTLDEETLNRLIDAKEDDLYLSNVSPLGVPFNNLRGNTKDVEKQQLIDNGKPGSTCPRKFVKLNTDLTEKAICTASRTYQMLKIKALEKIEMTKEKFAFEYNRIVEKSCICAGLGTSTLKALDADIKDIGPGVSVCPGPNMAYFSRKLSLQQMIDHIYGRTNTIERTDRPNFLVKELSLYIDYLKNKVKEDHDTSDAKLINYYHQFAKNLDNGIEYYQQLFSELKLDFKNSKQQVLKSFDDYSAKLQLLKLEILSMKPAPIKVKS